MCNWLSRSVSEILWHVAGTLSKRATNKCFSCGMLYSSLPSGQPGGPTIGSATNQPTNQPTTTTSNCFPYSMLNSSLPWVQLGQQQTNQPTNQPLLPTAGSPANKPLLPPSAFPSACCTVAYPQGSLVGLVVKASASRADDPGFKSRLRCNFSGSSHTSDLKIGIPVATLQGVWCYRVSVGTGQPAVSIL